MRRTLKVPVQGQGGWPLPQDLDPGGALSGVYVKRRSRVTPARSIDSLELASRFNNELGETELQNGGTR